MTLREYRAKMDAAILSDPFILDLPVVYSVDKSGTEFRVLNIPQPFVFSHWPIHTSDGNIELPSVCIN